MTRTLTTLAAAASVAIATVATPTEADARWRRYRHGFPAGAFITGIATGTHAYEPVYLGARCYVRRERVRDRRGWHVRRVIEVCY
jgi:hypothetical protein